MHFDRGGHRFTIDPAFRDLLEREGLLDFAKTMARGDATAVKTVLTARQTHRLTLGDGAVYYLKRYFRIPFFEALRDRFRERRMRGSIAREWHALRRLHHVMVPVPRPIMTAEEKGIFGVRRGYILTKGLEVRTTLEALAKNAFADTKSLEVKRKKRALLEEVAHLLRAVHRNGVAHRDFYLGHLVLAPFEDGDERVHVLDLNRAELYESVPERRRVKDLAALDFSAPERLFSRADRWHFLRTYLFPFERADAARWSRAVREKAVRMRRHVLRRVARGVPNFHVNE